MMERGAIGELIPESGVDGRFEWKDQGHLEFTDVYCDDELIAVFAGPKAIRLERVALFLTTEQS